MIQDSIKVTTTIDVNNDEDIFAVTHLQNLIRAEAGNYYYDNLVTHHNPVEMKVEIVFNSGGENNKIQLREVYGLNNEHRWQDVIVNTVWECDIKKISQVIVKNQANITVVITLY